MTRFICIMYIRAMAHQSKTDGFSLVAKLGIVAKTLVITLLLCTRWCRADTAHRTLHRTLDSLLLLLLVCMKCKCATCCVLDGNWRRMGNWMNTHVLSDFLFLLYCNQQFIRVLSSYFVSLLYFCSFHSCLSVVASVTSTLIFRMILRLLLIFICI